MNKVFCEECRRDTEYTIKEGKQKGNLKGEAYEFSGYKAVCNECGKEVYVTEVEDKNLKLLYDAYRQKNGIISLDKIQDIPKKYDIGIRPLSLLLGWGEMTFTRYCDGYMPTKQYSDVLQKIYDEPEYYKDLLEKNKKNLQSQLTYEKSIKKVRELLCDNTKNESKLELTVKYLLYCCKDITPLALQKALYYIQGLYYAFMGTFLYKEDCEAWVHGPVYKEIYNRYSKYCFDPIDKETEFDVSVFTSTEKAVMDSVVKYFCCYSGKILEGFTHLEMPWIKTREDLSPLDNSNRIISKKVIGEYFEEVKDKYKMIQFDDVKEYSDEMFKKCIKCC